MTGPRAHRQLPRRIVQLLLGLFLYGIAIAFMVVAELGAAPWDVLTLGLINHFPLTFGVMNVVVSVIVLLLWIPLRERPGIATLLNALLVGPSADVGLLLIPEAPNLWVQVLYYLIGLVLLGAATGMYIGAKFGSGPRDGLMTGLNRVTGLQIWVVRTTLEVGVVAVGWLLGGLVGIGTVVFVFTIGPLCQYFLKIFTVKGV
ncbi:membrane protein YczE [Leucobacter sp. gxy201]|uniref:membrane protein YczE n=1 Tax=Leucobacter sp. gxy201 TaxID=2957200 RepID=UPI003DA00F6E